MSALRLCISVCVRGGWGGPDCTTSKPSYTSQNTPLDHIFTLLLRMDVFLQFSLCRAALSKVELSLLLV